MTNISHIETTVQAMFDYEVAVGVTTLNRIAPTAYPVEAISVRGAVPARRNEFALGRSMARKAMQDLGVHPCAIPAAPDRSPVWPKGLAGSISHGGGLCLSVVSADPGVAAIGIDVDSATPLPSDLWEVVCDASELAWLMSQPAAIRGRLAKLIFCSKEAAYKSQYPVSKRLFGFDGFHVVIDLQAAQFEACFTGSVAPFRRGERLRGRFHIVDSAIICATAVNRICGTSSEYNEMVA